jgi:hypothetical protein
MDHTHRRKHVCTHTEDLSDPQIRCRYQFYLRPENWLSLCALKPVLLAPCAISSCLFCTTGVSTIKSVYISFRRARRATVPVPTDWTVAQGAAHGTTTRSVAHPTHKDTADCVHGSLFSQLPHAQSREAKGAGNGISAISCMAIRSHKDRCKRN